MDSGAHPFNRDICHEFNFIAVISVAMVVNFLTTVDATSNEQIRSLDLVVDMPNIVDNLITWEWIWGLYWLQLY